jgi:hypothetical protein
MRKPKPYAAGTTVEVGRTQAEIERLARRYGAESFASGWAKDSATLSFAMRGRMVRFRVELPRDRRKTEKDHRREERRRWRCLLLAIKAKLEVVETGIASFDEEFLAHVVMADDLTIWERVKLMEKDGRPLLPAIGS